MEYGSQLVNKLNRYARMIPLNKKVVIMGKFFTLGSDGRRQLVAVSRVVDIKETKHGCSLTINMDNEDYSTGISKSMDEIIAFLKSDDPILDL